MSYPNVNGFGVVNNPITESPYFENNDDGTNAFPEDDFLLLNDSRFLLLNGGYFLLLG